MTDARALLEVSDLVKHYPVRSGILRRKVGTVHAVDGVSFTVGVGETLGLVGESGCGKSTVARSILRLVEPTSGSIRLDGLDITHLGKADLRPHRRSMQIVFQDPFASLNPRMTAGDIVGEPLSVHGLAAGSKKRDRVAELFQQVGIAVVVDVTAGKGARAVPIEDRRGERRGAPRSARRVEEDIDAIWWNRRAADRHRQIELAVVVEVALRHHAARVGAQLDRQRSRRKRPVAVAGKHPEHPFVATGGGSVTARRNVDLAVAVEVAKHDERDSCVGRD